MSVDVELKEWTQIYLKSRDALQNVINDFESLNGDFIVKKKTGDQLFLIRPELTDAKEISEKCKGSSALVTLNTKKNVDFIISNWKILSTLDKLCIYFVNLHTYEKWMVFPHTHNSITEPAALRKGLESLFSMVPVYT